jgi:hypothetical protein
VVNVAAVQAQRRKHIPGERRGFTFAGVALGTILVVASAAGIVAAGIYSARLVRENREEELAGQAAREMIESLRRAPFAQVLALYDADPSNDPGGAGSAPGRNFDVLGLSPRERDADGRVGEVMFPTLGNALREDVVDAELSMPRDLNSDGVVDDADHAADYRMLPVRIRLQWHARTADRTLVVNQLLTGPGTP